MNKLPNDILYVILKHLAEDPVERYVTVCKRWNLAISADKTTRVLYGDNLMLVSLVRSYKYLNIDGIVHLELHIYYDKNSIIIPKIVPLKDAVFVVLTNIHYRLSPRMRVVQIKLHERIIINLYVKNNLVKHAIVSDKYVYQVYSSAEYIDILAFIKDLLYVDQHIEQLKHRPHHAVFRNDALYDYIDSCWDEDFERLGPRCFNKRSIVEFIDEDLYG